MSKVWNSKLVWINSQTGSLTGRSSFVFIDVRRKQSVLTLGGNVACYLLCVMSSLLLTTLVSFTFMIQKRLNQFFNFLKPIFQICCSVNVGLKLQYWFCFDKLTAMKYIREYSVEEQTQDLYFPNFASIWRWRSISEKSRIHHRDHC